MIATDEKWLHIDEALDVLGSLRHANACALLSAEDELAWKWWMLATHSALQGACVCHLLTSASPLGVVTQKNAKEWVEYFENRRNDPDAILPRTNLMNLPELLKAVRKPRSAGDRGDHEVVAISDHEFALLSNFHEKIRNQFVHFAPMGWSIEISGIPDIARLIAGIISQIDDVGYGFRHLSPSEKSELRIELKRLTKSKID